MNEQRLDQILTKALAPPTLSASFRPALYQRLDAPPSSWPSFTLDAVPDILHLVGCAAVTAYCALLVPTGASTIVATGTLATVATYVVLAAVRNSLDERAL